MIEYNIVLKTQTFNNRKEKEQSYWEKLYETFMKYTTLRYN